MNVDKKYCNMNISTNWNYDNWAAAMALLNTIKNINDEENLYFWQYKRESSKLLNWEKNEPVKQKQDNILYMTNIKVIERCIEIKN